MLPLNKLEVIFDDLFNKLLNVEDGDFEEKVEKASNLLNQKIEEYGCIKTIRMTETHIYENKQWVPKNGIPIRHPYEDEFIIVPEDLALKITTLGYLP